MLRWSTIPKVARLLPILSLFSLASCGGSDAPAPGPGGDAGAGVSGDTLVIAYQSDADSLLYIVSQSAADSMVIGELNYSLFDSDFECDLQMKPALAKSWSYNEEGTVLSIELRDDITWADGTPVTVEDIIFTYDLIADPVVASPRYAYVERMVEGKRPLKIDDTHIEWHFTEAFDRNTQMAQISLALAPKHLLHDADRSTLRGHDFTTNPVVNGRWKLAKWDRSQKIVLEPNDKWTGPAEEKPNLNRVIFRILPEYATRLVELETGGVDLMEGIQIADADRLAEEHKEIEIHRRGWRFMDYIAWNNLDPEDYKAKLDALPEGETLDLTTVAPHPLFGDRGVRRALGRAINVDKLIDDLLTSKVTGEKYGRRAVSTITPELCDYHNNDITPFPYEPEVAKAELAELGWVDTDDDGILDQDGTPFRFTLITNSGNPRRAKASVIVQANLKEIGIDMQIAQIETNTFFETTRKKDFHAALSGWSAGLFVDPTDQWHSGAEYEFNFPSYNNPEVDALIQKGMATSDPAEAQVIWRELQTIIYEDQPYAFLFWRDEIVGLNSRFENTTIDILSAFRDIHNWSVPADKVKYQR